MPLYIDNELLDSSQSFNPVDVFEKYPQLCERSETFRKNLQKIQINEKDRVLFAHQREIVTISPQLNKQNFTHVCSDEATTCYNVVLIEKTTNTISLAHFDGCSTENGIKTMFAELSDVITLTTTNCDLSKIQYDMYLFGGFIDDKKYSEKLFSELMYCCVTFPYNVKLQIACCHSMNNVTVNEQNSPDIYGIAVEINDNNNITIASCLQRGPDSTLRDVRMSATDLFSPIYDYRKQMVYIDPFIFKKMSYTNKLLQLDDETYLMYCSTSPHCEPANFVKRSKLTLLFRVAWEKRIREIFCEKRREYVFEDNKWILLDDEQTVLNS